jgi:hypothetical protein
VVISSEILKTALSPRRWHFYQLGVGSDGSVQLWEDGHLLGKGMLPLPEAGPLAVRLGGFKGWLDDLHIQKGLPTASSKAKDS